MKRFFAILFISLLAFGCKPEAKTGNDTLPDSVIRPLEKDRTDVAILADSTKLIGPHLSDTAMFKGSWIIFLRPDSARLDFYSKKLESGIYQMDAEFGDAIAMTGDSIVSNKDFKGIKGMVSTKRYITVVDCKECPVTIDRDTVNYGVILTASGKSLKAEQNVYDGPHYIKAVKKYFGIKK
jgi:hypothetical protein